VHICFCSRARFEREEHGFVSPRIAAALAARIVPYGKALLILSLTSLVVLAGALFLVRTKLASDFVFAAFGPLVLIPWGFVCLAQSFGPGSKFSRRSDRFINRALAWYAALFLLFWLALACAWPFVVLLM
jgi:hypothetical protein